MSSWAIYTRQRTRVDFPYAFFDANKNAIYLTTEQLVPTNVNQLRGVLDAEGNFKGHFIVDGTGKTLPLELKKQKEHLDVGDTAMAANGHSSNAVGHPSDRGETLLKRF